MCRDRTIVAVPGPPPVKIYGSLKTVNAPTTVKIMVTKNICFTCGTVI